MSNNLVSRARLFQALWGVCLILGGAAIVWLDPTWAVLAVSLLVLTAMLAVAGLFRFAGAAAAILGVGLMAGVQYATQGLSSQALVPVGVGAAALGATALMGGLANRQVGRLARQVENDRKLIDDLRMYDPDTELLRLTFGLQNLRLEIARSRRYGKDTSLILLQIANLPEVMQTRGLDGVKALQAQFAGVLKSCVRDTDVPFADTNRLGAILPETGPEGARVFCERLTNTIAQRLRSAARIGVAAYPNDGVSEDELLRAAEAALQVAQISAEPVVFSARIHNPPDNGHASVPGTSVPPATPSIATAVDPSALPLAADEPNADPEPASRPSLEAVAVKSPPLAAPERSARPEPKATPETASAIAQHKTLLRVSGIKQAYVLLQLETALRDIPGVERVKTLEFGENGLVLCVFHQPEALLPSLAESAHLGVLRHGADWIEAEWKNGHGSGQ